MCLIEEGEKPSIHRTDNSPCGEKPYESLLDLLSAARYNASEVKQPTLQFYINFNNDILLSEYTFHNNVVSGSSHAVHVPKVYNIQPMERERGNMHHGGKSQFAMKPLDNPTKQGAV